MSSSEHLRDNGAASMDERINALMRQNEALYLEKERLIAEKDSLEEIRSLEDMAKLLRSDIKRLAAANESLRESTARSTEEASTAGTAACEGSNYLAQELNRVRDIALGLGLDLQEPMKHDELSVLCSVICDEEQLADLEHATRFYADYHSRDGYFFCLRQAGLNIMEPMLDFGEDGLRCEAHGDDDACVWITKREGRWVIGTGRG